MGWAECGYNELCTRCAQKLLHLEIMMYTLYHMLPFTKRDPCLDAGSNCQCLYGYLLLVNHIEPLLTNLYTLNTMSEL